jgi:hypothetical protein|tara:strand:- start:1235 stop:1477 length:243 start_codon:yes stop_codon:yes gene_type:complete
MKNKNSVEINPAPTKNPFSGKDWVTIRMERDKAEYLSACFKQDLKWLGVTAGIDRGLCYHDFIKQVKMQCIWLDGIGERS